MLDIDWGAIFVPTESLAEIAIRGTVIYDDELGQEMHARKAELMQEHGLMEDDGGKLAAGALAGERTRSRAQGQGAARRSR